MQYLLERAEPKKGTKMPLVVGVRHEYDDSFSRIRDYVSRNIKPGQTVSIESAFDLDELSRTSGLNIRRKYMHELSREIIKSGAYPRPVEDRESHAEQGVLWKKHKMSKDSISKDPEDSAKFLGLSRRRSESMIYQSICNGSDMLFVGAAHAYDMMRRGYPNVTFLDEVDSLCITMIERGEREIGPKKAQLLLPDKCG